MDYYLPPQHPIMMTPLITIVVGIVLTALVFITIIGNVLVCLSVVLVRKLRKPQNYLLVSLAVSDLFVALFVMPFAIVFELNEQSWPLSDGLCDLWVSADVLSCTASILNLCAISVDRYQAITRPLEYSGTSSPRRMLFVIFGVWLSAACVSLPPVLLLGNEHEDTCVVSQNFWYQIYATMASFYIPLTVMVVVYAKILRVVAEKRKQMSWTNNSRNCSMERTHIHLDMHYLQEEPGGGGGRGGSSLCTCLTSSHNRNHHHNHNHHHGHRHSCHGDCSTNCNLCRQGCGGCLRTSSGMFPWGWISKGRGRRLERSNTATSKGLTKGVQLRIHQGPSTRSPSNSGTNRHSMKGLKKLTPAVRLKDHKAYTTLGIIMAVFILCWCPFFILALIRPFAAADSIPDWMSSLFLWLGYFNSSLNPVIYATTNRDFRRPFREILCLRCSTLDDLMRREFYDHQYGGDEYIARNKIRKLPGSSSTPMSIGMGISGPLMSPTSGSMSDTNILSGSSCGVGVSNSVGVTMSNPRMIVNNSTNSTSSPIRVPPLASLGECDLPMSQTQSPATPIRLQGKNTRGNGHSCNRTSSPWLTRNSLNRTLETQLTPEEEEEEELGLEEPEVKVGESTKNLEEDPTNSGNDETEPEEEEHDELTGEREILSVTFNAI